jgi:hypothetical protein
MASDSSRNGKPDALRPAHPLSFFDPEHVERPTPARPWLAMLLVSLAVTAALTAGYEIYWRGKMFRPGDIENSSALWAQERRKATGDATVIIGSSRIFFDVDLDVWEEAAGVRPVQLALEGTSPRIFLKDLAEDEDFRGLVIVGVTSMVFFTQDGGLRAEVLDYTRDQSPSQRIDHWLSMYLDDAFAFMSEQTRPKRQMQLAPLPLRDGMKPLFSPRKLSISARDRNTEMWARVAEDERYRKEATDQWLLAFRLFAPPPGPNGEPPPPMPDEAINAVIAEVKANADKIRARGGDVAFVQSPYDGGFMPIEEQGFPRARFWDRLLAGTDSAGVTFLDHPELQGYVLPEWSHLEASEAERYTRALVPIFYNLLEEKNAERSAG